MSNNLLALATLGDMTKIEIIQFILATPVNQGK